MQLLLSVIALSRVLLLPSLIFSAWILLVRVWAVHIDWPEIEILLHTGGGIAIAHSSWMLVRMKTTLQSIAAQLVALFAVVAIVMVSAVGWEIFEAHFFAVSSFQIESPDTRKDLIVGILAGFISGTYFILRQEIYRAGASIIELVSATSEDNKISIARSRS